MTECNKSNSYFSDFGGPDRLGFTLIELLVVVGIIAVLAAILFPVFASAKRAAKQAVSSSNLNQCYLAMTIYADDNGGMQNLPHDPVSSRLFGSAPTCDPLDVWRIGCKKQFGIPMVGSYAYAGSVFSRPNNAGAWPDWFLSGKFGLPYVADIFVAHNLPDDFVGLDQTHESHDALMPDQVLFLYPDGHSRISHCPKDDLSSLSVRKLFNWSQIFLDYPRS